MLFFSCVDFENLTINAVRFLIKSKLESIIDSRKPIKAIIETFFSYNCS